MKNNENHLTIDEINKFCSFHVWDEQNVELVERVNSHIERCEECRKRLENMIKTGVGAYSADTAEDNADFYDHDDEGIDYGLDRPLDAELEKDLRDYYKYIAEKYTGEKNRDDSEEYELYRVLKRSLLADSHFETEKKDVDKNIGTSDIEGELKKCRIKEIKSENAHNKENKERAEKIFNIIAHEYYFDRMFDDAETGRSDSEDDESESALMNQTVDDMFSALKELYELQKDGKNKKKCEDNSIMKYIKHLKKLDEIAQRSSEDLQPQKMYLEELDNVLGSTDELDEASKKKRRGRNRDMLKSN